MNETIFTRATFEKSHFASLLKIKKALNIKSKKLIITQKTLDKMYICAEKININLHKIECRYSLSLWFNFPKECRVVIDFSL